MNEMDVDSDILEQAQAALNGVGRIDTRTTPVAIYFSDGVLTAEAEMPDVAAKKLALEALAAVPGVRGIVDRLHVTPAERMEDGEIRDLMRDALLQDPALANIALYEVVKGERLIVRDPHGAGLNSITITVEDGIVTLDGDVPGLAQKRLAGVLAWWVPGSRDVINGIAVTPPEEDNDEEITEAVRVALEKDPFVNAGQVHVRTRNSEVVLDGLVPGEPEKDMAEFDAWYVFGVDRVDNRIVVES
jgi:osmotically-inducible protein OsmY